MLCTSCGSQFAGHSHLGVILTIVCRECITSSDLVTKTAAVYTGASLSKISDLHCLYKRNPHYSSGAPMQLFVREEVDVLAAMAATKKRQLQESAARAKQESDARQKRIKVSRDESLQKRMKGLHGIIPTPGLVCGDFLSTETKTPKVGVRSLLARRAIWNRASQAATPTAVQIFEWAVRNKKTNFTNESALGDISRERSLWDKVAANEGHRTLSYLDLTDRLVLTRANPVYCESIPSLPVRELSDELTRVCDVVAADLNLPFATVLNKLDESSNSWIWKHLLVIRPDRVAKIMEPHFLAPSKRQKMLKQHMKESFARWGLSSSGNLGRVDFFVNYFRGDIVDVEFYSASFYILEACVPYYPTGAESITTRVMNSPGVTWVQAAHEYVEEQLVIREEKAISDRARAQERFETSRMCKEDKYPYKPLFRPVCSCGNPAARECLFGLCGCCCRGPCVRHGR